MQDYFYLIGFIAIFIASYTDIQKREVPDLLTYGLFGFALILRILFSLYLNSISIFLEGLLGGLIAFSIGAFMYYTGQWGGGDTKLLAGLGILFGLPFAFEFSFFTIFIINILFGGAIYLILFSIYLTVKNLKKFKEEFIKTSKKYRVLKIYLIIFLIFMFFSILMMTNSILKITVFSFSFMFTLLLYLYIFIKSVENAIMIKKYSVSKLTEGDWIAEDVFIGKKRITGPKDLGITIEKIKLLKKNKIKQVMVKEGIPFVPSFLISFLLTYFFGNWFFNFFGQLLF